ncbi:hypothetical protein [Helicobacter sp. T3_23-1056]
MLISVKIESEEFVELLVDRLKFWTQDEEIIEAFEKMWLENAESGAFCNSSVSKMGIMQIVDNDWVNWVSVIKKSKVSAEDWEELQKLQRGDLSEIESPLESLDVSKNVFLEIITDEIALVRH